MRNTAKKGKDTLVPVLSLVPGLVTRGPHQIFRSMSHELVANPLEVTVVLVTHSERPQTLAPQLDIQEIPGLHHLKYGPLRDVLSGKRNDKPKHWIGDVGRHTALQQ